MPRIGMPQFGASFSPQSCEPPINARSRGFWEIFIISKRAHFVCQWKCVQNVLGLLLVQKLQTIREPPPG